MGKVRESEEVLKKAIALFEAMNAPRQVNKVSGIWANASAEP
ncbi:MAG: hypothetical protein HC852_23830 [Acaryochloridaceae cyanobacterium RU_4_10]|nr:hypothetical protein [Acaryochloridaceae cyanobacterium RU_4_10]